MLLFAGHNPLTNQHVRHFQGLSVTGPASGDAPSTLRRAQGLHETCLNELRPASGNATIFGLAGIHSIARFNDVRYVGAGTSLYSTTTLILGGLSGEPLTLLRLPPGNSQPDRLFVAGGGLLRKVDTSDNVTFWGIDAPPDGFTVALVTQLIKDIELFEDFTDWTVSPGTVTAADEATILQEGAASLKVTVPASTLAILEKTVSLDLSEFAAPGDSSIEDFIEIWVRVDASTPALDYITLRFDVANGDFASDYYQYKFLPTSVNINRTALVGVADDILVNADEAGFIADTGDSTGTDNSVDSPSEADSAPAGTDDGVTMSSNTWSRLRVPKSRFTRSGAGSGTWADVAGIQLMVSTNNLGSLIAYFDFCRMRGGAGMLGDYQSLVTFENTETGHRSNSNPIPVRTNQNDRQQLDYANLPVSSDPQVDARTLWRTLGSGARFFREHVIEDNVTTTYRSRVADFVGMWTNQDSEVLFLPELPTDNIRPLDSHVDFIYDQATVFWLSGEFKGRVYYSPAGRPEAQRGFIQVCQDDTPLFRIIVWQRARYVVGEAGWYRIDGTEPYTAFKFEGIPGVNQAQARTVVPTPYGVLWQAQDGLRVFNGSRSDLMQFDRIGPLFRGEALEQLSAMLGTYGAFARDQYFITDGDQTISFNLATGFIRDLGQGFESLYYEDDTRLLLGATTAGLVVVESVGTAPAVLCSWETAALYSPPGEKATLQRIYFDAHTGGQAWDVTIIVDDVEYKYPPFVRDSRGFVEYPIGRAYQSVSVRVDFVPTSNSRLFQVYADIYTNAVQK